MTFDIIIPARFSSTRLPGKPLIDLLGKTLIERVYQAALASDAERVIIATDDERIQTEVKRFGGEVCMTATAHLSGTDRLAEVVDKLALDPSRVVVNVQGDEPFINPLLINEVADALLADHSLKMSTACHSMKVDSEADLESISNPNVVKVVLNDSNEALYFSRSPIPYLREPQQTATPKYLQHMGIYAYRAGFIKQFSEMPASVLEQLESLEQLRVLEAGHRIKVVHYHGDLSIGVDTPDDVEKAIAHLQKGIIS